MLFKDKLFLTNCDSVRKLDRNELWKRIRIGLVFADGIILSPNTLIDNEHIYHAFDNKNIIKYLNEEGFEKVVLRGNIKSSDQSLMDYYDKLPEDFIVSSIKGSPRKSNLEKDQEKDLMTRIRKMDAFLANVSAPREPIQLADDSLSSMLLERIAGIDYLAADNVSFLREGFAKVVSRSKAYGFIESTQPKELADKLKVELIDPSYNSLFVKQGEAFVQDRIMVLSGLPNRILQAGVTIRSLRNEIELARFIFELIIFIKTFGVEELRKFLTDKAIEFAEDKLKEMGLERLSRKNWFGLYPKLAKKMGVEFK
jgi:hypothetical protein